ncbi:MAG: class I SAM-dependent methyltransferase, partial [Candidatus Atribacteria bacterium]|nr:class I SAM-dependent methyltransferase [Candidatus Atribacteria bacterium]
MTTKIDVSLGHIQKTLFLPLWGRAMESKKPHPLLIDDLAVKIIDSVNFDFSLMSKNLDDIIQIAWIKRSLICDQIINKFLSHNPKGTIINIGCGLDTTFERIDNGYLTWYDLDLPDVIELRRKFIKESVRRKFIASSFLEKAW